MVDLYLALAPVGNEAYRRQPIQTGLTQSPRAPTRASNTLALSGTSPYKPYNGLCSASAYGLSKWVTMPRKDRRKPYTAGKNRRLSSVNLIYDFENVYQYIL